MSEFLMTTRDVANMLGLSSEAVLRRWRSGELPGFRLSTKALRFRESEVLDWVEARREGHRRRFRICRGGRRLQVTDSSRRRCPDAR